MEDLVDTHIIKRLSDIIENTIERSINKEIDQNANYVNEFSIDSLEFIRIVVAIEEEFNVTIGDDHLIIESLDTFRKIVNLVNRS